MRRTVIAATMILAAGSPALGQGHVHRALNPIHGQYIVTLDDEALPVAALERGKRESIPRWPGADVLPLVVLQRGKPLRVPQLVVAIAAERGIELRATYVHALTGFVARMTQDQAESIAGEPWVRAVEEDGLVEVTATEASPPSWGLDRIDQHGLPLDGAYTYNDTGSGVDVYIIDSGIRATHEDFGGRVDTVNAFTSVDDGFGTDDRFGHGTMVAGVVAGATFGVAKGATLHPVRVIDSTGNGTISGMIAGIDWIASQFESQVINGTRRPAVVNISLITGGSPAMNAAVNNSITSGITYVAAAGNTGDDSCGYSPAGIAAVITVGASDDTDTVWPDSNNGACVDVFAPGVLVNTTLSRTDTDTTATTGTSIAAPHVAGVAALFLAANPTATPAEVSAAILSQATPGALAAVPPNTPNLLLYSAFAGQGQP